MLLSNGKINQCKQKRRKKLLLVNTNLVTKFFISLLFVHSFTGGGLFDTLLVVAVIGLVSGTVTVKRPILRDIPFYLAAALMVFLFIHSRHFTLTFAIGKYCSRTNQHKIVSSKKCAVVWFSGSKVFAKLI